MLDGIVGFGTSLLGFLTPTAIAYALISSLVGFIIGALPGLTATMGVALMTTLTIKLPPGDALLIAGKGHETGQSIGSALLPFSDHEAVRAALAEAAIDV